MVPSSSFHIAGATRVPLRKLLRCWCILAVIDYNRPSRDCGGDVLGVVYSVWSMLVADGRPVCWL